MISRPTTIIGRRIVTPEGVRPAAIHIEGGRIKRVGAPNEARRGSHVLDAGSLLVLPGLVDTHVHVNEPGRTDWEGFQTATRAAVAGGVTALLDMPLNSVPPTTSVAALEEKVIAAQDKCAADVGFIGGVVPGNTGQLAPLYEAGVRAFKCFLVPSGVDEFPHVGERDLREAMRVLTTLGAPLMVHAEVQEPIDAATAAAQGRDPRSYDTYLSTRPAAAEVQAVALVIRLCEETGARAHIVHLSSADSLPLLRAARARGVAISAETCPHYLVLEPAQIPAGATEFKCAPPVRGGAHSTALWDALHSGDVDMIVSDHSPCPPAMKRRDTGDFLSAWGGIASLQLGISIVWSAMRERDMSAAQLGRWMSSAPARLAGLHDRKGAIAAGRDADIVLFDPDAPLEVTPAMLLHRHPITPYVGRRLTGRVEATYLAGELVYDGNSGPLADARGRLLLRALRGLRD